MKKILNSAPAAEHRLRHSKPTGPLSGTNTTSPHRFTESQMCPKRSEPVESLGSDAADPAAVLDLAELNGCPSAETLGSKENFPSPLRDLR